MRRGHRACVTISVPHLDADLAKSASEEEARAIRGRAARSLSVLSERHRRIENIAVRDPATGEVHSSLGSVSELLARHWASVFATAPSPSRVAIHPLLSECSKLSAGETFGPIKFAEFSEVFKHTASASLGPDGLPIYNLYLHAVRDGSLPLDFNESLLLFIPKASPGLRPEAGDGVADLAGFRPISLSNTLNNCVAKALNATLEKLAARLVHCG